MCKMEEKINKLYSDFHAQRLGIHCYPNEFLVRTMLGDYPNLRISHDYHGKKVLDWGCGDGRNILLLHNCGLDVSAFEITEEICNGVKERVQRLYGFPIDIRVGRNNKVPFEDKTFDYIVASSSVYYVDHDSNFDENYNELCRVIKAGGYVIMSLSQAQNFILKDCVKWQCNEGHYQITNDPYGLRNGDIFRVWQNEEEIIETFSKDFEDICIGKAEEDYYGMHIALWLVVMRKK